jgi:hypothetical protein
LPISYPELLSFRRLTYFRSVNRIITTFFALILIQQIQAQYQVRDSALFDPHVSVIFGYQTPSGDMAKRFRDNQFAGLGFHIKSKKNWYYGVEGTYLFGKSVNEPGLLDNIVTNDGYVLDNQGQLVKMNIQERGFTFSLDGGKILDIIGPNKNSGLLLMGGVGMLQHKIRLEHQENTITQLDGEYIKGYDRLTNGLMIKQFVGYYHMSNNRLVNFFIGIEAMEAFTKSRRNFNFDTQTKDTAERRDYLFGIKAGWTLHLYVRAADAYYYN